MKDLRGKTAVITGGGSGIGRAIAHALAEEGANVVIADLNLAAAEGVRDSVIQHGVRSLAVHVDVADYASVERLCDTAYENFERVDILINNAGVSWRPLRPITKATLADWKFFVDINLWGVVHGVHAFLPRMSAQTGEKHIVNTSSRAVVLPVKGHTPYNATKAAVTAMSESIAAELADQGFGVTILQPASVRTNIIQNSEDLRPDEEQEVWLRSNDPQTKAATDPSIVHIDAEPVGRMVCDAILRNQLYLNTHPISAETIQHHTDLVFGPATYGRASPKNAAAE